jgi:ribosomal protein S18 acetylase RimI-like enzyme
MTPRAARQIADLLNQQNVLTRQYTARMILDAQDNYIVSFDGKEAEKVLGAVELKRVQWYQCEIDHLTVDPELQRGGIGSELLREAESRAIALGARVVQCTIRVGNVKSEAFFKKHGYVPTVTFFNRRGHKGNRVTVYQRALIVGPVD